MGPVSVVGLLTEVFYTMMSSQFKYIFIQNTFGHFHQFIYINIKTSETKTAPSFSSPSKVTRPNQSKKNSHHIILLFREAILQNTVCSLDDHIAVHPVRTWIWTWQIKHKIFSKGLAKQIKPSHSKSSMRCPPTGRNQTFFFFYL